MMRDKRLGRGSAGDGLHHRRLNFQKISGNEKLANSGNDGAACLKSLHYFRIGPQVHVSLPVALINIRQAVKFLRSGQQAFAQ